MSTPSSKKRVPKIVLDTNVWASATVWGGVPAKIIHLAEDGRVQVFTSSHILSEISRILDYPKLRAILDRTGVRKDTVLAKVAEIGHLVGTGRALHLVKDDPSDNRILECAIAARVDYIVSGDQHLLRLGRFKEIRILNVSDFLAIMRRVT